MDIWNIVHKGICLQANIRHNENILPVGRIGGWIRSAGGTVEMGQVDTEIRTQESLHKVQSPLHQSAKSALHSEHDKATWPPQLTWSKIKLFVCVKKLFQFLGYMRSLNK